MAGVSPPRETLIVNAAGCCCRCRQDGEKSGRLFHIAGAVRRQQVGSDMSCGAVLSLRSVCALVTLRWCLD